MIAAVVASSLVAFILGLLAANLKRPHLGSVLFLSADKADLQLLLAGKLCNMRVSNRKELAEAAHGETGLEVTICGKF